MSHHNLSPEQFKFLLATSTVVSNQTGKLSREDYQDGPSRALLGGETGGHARLADKASVKGLGTGYVDPEKRKTELN